MTVSDKGAVLVTGSAGFIGFHLCSRLLQDGFDVVGVDALTDYYDVGLKKDRHAILENHKRFKSHIFAIEEQGRLHDLVAQIQPRFIVHLAAQAGVRYSIDAPRSYVQSNLVGTLELLEAARAFPPEHMLLASTSSAYGANTQMPYRETDQADHQMSFYAATKKANEAMAHSYAHLYGLPTTMFRFFTVYGSWGRPDMALFKFVKAITSGQAIDLYNNGDMKRDFTYVEDLVEGIGRLMMCKPGSDPVSENDSLSPVAPWRVVNIGNGSPVELAGFVGAIEQALGLTAERNLMPMQAGDVPATWAEDALITELVGALPKTPLDEGVKAFCDWYTSYFGKGSK